MIGLEDIITFGLKTTYSAMDWVMTQLDGRHVSASEFQDLSEALKGDGAFIEPRNTNRRDGTPASEVPITALDLIIIGALLTLLLRLKLYYQKLQTVSK